MPDSPAKRPWWRRWFGSRSERAAAGFLRRHGHRLLARNYRCPHGELDLVTRDGPTVVFAEVRSTGGTDLSIPASSVDDAKQRRLTRAALHFLQAHRLLEHPARFDVLVVGWPAAWRRPQVLHFPAAFEAAGRSSMYA